MTTPTAQTGMDALMERIRARVQEIAPLLMAQFDDLIRAHGRADRTGVGLTTADVTNTVKVHDSLVALARKDVALTELCRQMAMLSLRRLDAANDR